MEFQRSGLRTVLWSYSASELSYLLLHRFMVLIPRWLHSEHMHSAHRKTR